VPTGTLSENAVNPRIRFRVEMQIRFGESCNEWRNSNLSQWLDARNHYEYPLACGVFIQGTVYQLLLQIECPNAKRAPVLLDRF
jgi:hypothetical protein